jgi:hydrogenase/urease accessory protein HupE
MSALLAPMHVLALVALGLLIGQQRWRYAVVIVYAAAVLIGLCAIALAYVPQFAEEGLLAATAMAGILVAWARPWPAWLGAILAAGVGLTLALCSPPETLSLAQANLELAATAVGAIAAMWVIARLGQWLNRPLEQLAARILGSWIAASAILAVTLRLFR